MLLAFGGAPAVEHILAYVPEIASRVGTAILIQMVVIPL